MGPRTQLAAAVLAVAAAAGYAASVELSWTDGEREVDLDRAGGWWQSQTMYDDWMEAGHDSGWLLNRSSPAVAALLAETRWAWPASRERVCPHATEMCLDGLLGGWNRGVPGNRPPASGPDPTQDVATRDPRTHAVVVNATALYSRVDGAVAAGLAPMINLQNVPWALSRNTSSRGSYGEMAPPANLTEWGSVVGAVVRLLVARYGRDAVTRWRFRVWTEPNNPDSFSGTVDDYAAMYDHAAAAVVAELGRGATVGPANFCRACTETDAWPYWGGVERLLDHFRSGVNHATGQRGSPVGFLSMSAYGNYGAPPVDKLGYGPEATVATAALLRSWRARLGKAAGEIPVELHEYGTYVNRHWRPSGEPGAFGGAWAVGNWIAGLDGGVTRFFHWAWYDTTWLGVETFWVSSLGWAMTTASLASDAAVVAGGGGGVGGSGAGKGSMSVIAVAAPTGLPNVTVSAAGFAAPLSPSLMPPSSSGAAGSKGVVVLVAALPANKSVTGDVELTISIGKGVWRDRCGGSAAGDGHAGASGTAAVATAMRLDKASSPFDLMLRELQAAGGYPTMLRYDDGEVYDIGTMATPAGVTHLGQPGVSARLLAAQRASFQWRAFNGTVRGDGAGGVVLTTTVSPPCTLLVNVSCA